MRYKASRVHIHHVQWIPAEQVYPGAAKNHQQRRSNLRSQVRQEIATRLRKWWVNYCILFINTTLEQITKAPNARMEYKYYFRNVVQRYSVILEGWPDEIRLEDFSKASVPYAGLEELLRKLKSGDICWKRLTPAELEEHEQQRDAQIASGEVVRPVPRRRRSDCGKKRKHWQQSPENHGGDTDEEGQSAVKRRMKTRRTAAGHQHVLSSGSEDSANKSPDDASFSSEDD